MRAIIVRCFSATILLMMLSTTLFVRTSTGLMGPEQTLNMAEVEIDEVSLSIDVSFNGSFTDVLHCRVVLLLDLGIIVESVEVYLLPEFPSELSVVLSEYHFVLTPEGSVKEFTANVTVAPGTSSSADPQVVIGGTATAQPRGTKGGIIEDTAGVTVLPFYTAEISFKEPKVSISTGNTGKAELTVENRGNADEYYLLRCENAAELSGDGVSVTITETRVFLNEAGETDIEVEVKVDKSTHRGAYIVRIGVWSEKNGQENMEDSKAVLTVEVSSEYVGGIEEFLSKEPYYLYIALAIGLVIVAAAIWGILKLREHLAWRRTLSRIRKRGLEAREERDPPENGP